MAEGGGLLNRYTLQRRIQGSNPCVSARFSGSESLALCGARKLIRNAFARAGSGGHILRSGRSWLRLAEVSSANSSQS